MTTTCAECGMPVDPAEYHPYAACLMFKACHDSAVVKANLSGVWNAATLAERESIATRFAQEPMSQWWGVDIAETIRARTE